MARAVVRDTPLAEPDRVAIDGALARAFGPLGRASGDLSAIREALYETMWDDVGILRTAEGLAQGADALRDLSLAVADAGISDGERRYNLTWMDRLNLENLIAVSQTICAAAQARVDSRGAHFREDHPQTSDLATSRYTVVRQDGDTIKVDTQPVAFTIVQPGRSLLDEAA